MQRRLAVEIHIQEQNPALHVGTVNENRYRSVLVYTATEDNFLQLGAPFRLLGLNEFMVNLPQAPFHVPLFDNTLVQ